MRTSPSTKQRPQVIAAGLVLQLALSRQGQPEFQLIEFLNHYIKVCAIHLFILLLAGHRNFKTCMSVKST